jgi:glucokinase
MLLAGDIGGTNSRLALCEVSGSRVEVKRERTYRSREHDSLASIVRAFVEEDHGDPELEAAAFGVAGPVREGRRARISNLTWEVDVEELKALLDLEAVAITNDLEATAYGIGCLDPSDLVVLREGSPPPDGNEALIAAGTGLGEAGLHWEGDGHRPFPSEGGHCEFAPRSDVEVSLLRHLWNDHDHVSYERVVSGPGLYNIYGFLRDTGRGEEPDWLAAAISVEDPAPVIAAHALSRHSKLCSDALDLFVSVYGAEAGNLALKLMATAGLFVGGGIAPKILPRLAEGGFLASFTAKGRMSKVLSRIPVRVVVSDRCALFGAARLARKGAVDVMERNGG